VKSKWGKSNSFDFLTISYWWQLPVSRWLYDNPHTQYTIHIDIEKRRRCVYDWRGFKIYDWRRRLSHMQMTDSDLSLNDWRRRRRRSLDAMRQISQADLRNYARTVWPGQIRQDVGRFSFLRISHAPFQGNGDPSTSSNFGWRFGVAVTRVGLDQRSCSTSSPVSTGMGDCLRAGKPSHYVTSHPGQLSLSSFRGR